LDYSLQQWSREDEQSSQHQQQQQRTRSDVLQQQQRMRSDTQQQQRGQRNDAAFVQHRRSNEDDMPLLRIESNKSDLLLRHSQDDVRDFFEPHTPQPGVRGVGLGSNEGVPVGQPAPLLTSYHSAQTIHGVGPSCPSNEGTSIERLNQSPGGSTEPVDWPSEFGITVGHVAGETDVGSGLSEDSNDSGMPATLNLLMNLQKSENKVGMQLFFYGLADMPGCISFSKLLFSK